MLLNKESIIEICQNYLPIFKKTIKDIKYELKGIINSEMLLFVSLTKYFKVDLIIESGRANGQSTKVIGENFRESNYKIYSIEYNKYSLDVKRSFKKLNQYKNIDLLFGDSIKLIPKLITEECCILIDGPKDVEAIKFALECLKNTMVKAVFIHDLNKDTPHREWVEKIFINCFFSDDKDYVDKFKSIDKKCWLEQLKFKECEYWKPYVRLNKVRKSYFATISVIINSTNFYNPKVYENYLEIMNKRNRKRSWKIKFLFENWPTKIRNIIQFPSLYLFYEKNINRRKQLNYVDFIKEWVRIIISQILPIFKKRVIATEHLT